MFFNSKIFGALVLAFIAGVHAESHTVHFVNNCHRGTPTLIQGANVLSTGGDFTINDPLRSAIAYLQTGSCGFNGEGCTMVELTLVNPTPGMAGSGSSADITLIPPHAFSVTTGFGYFNGCDGAGADCTSPTCPTAFFESGQTDRQVACQANNTGCPL